MRRIARHRRARPIATAIAGRVYALRNRRRTLKERWQQARSSETAYWDEWIATSDDIKLLTRPECPVTDPALVSTLDRITSETVDILDVGAGPVTKIGRNHPGKKIRIVATDALADDYDRLLDKHDVEPPVRTIKADGEQLLDTVSRESFDIAHCRNALDHCYDPVRVIDNMLAAVRPGGYVVLRHYVNEGESQLYLGMHQWNLDEHDGRFTLASQGSERIDVGDRLSLPHRLTCAHEAHDDKKPELVVTIERLG